MNTSQDGHLPTIDGDGDRRRYRCSCGKVGSWKRKDWRGNATYGAYWAFRAHVATLLGWSRRKTKQAAVSIATGPHIEEHW